MLITDAIKALEAAKDALGDEARLFVSLPGAEGWTSDCLTFVGPLALELDKSKQGVSLVVLNTMGERGELNGLAGLAGKTVREWKA